MKYLDVPYFKQDTDYTCGPTALQMVFAFYGKKFSEENLTQILDTNSEVGTQHHALIATATSHGLHCYVNDRSNLEELRYLLRLRVPSIVHFVEPEADDDHYAVVVGVTEDSVVLNDPWHGEHFQLSVREFLDRWLCEALGDCERWLIAFSEEPFRFGKQYNP